MNFFTSGMRHYFLGDDFDQRLERRKKMFLIQERSKGRSFNRLVSNMDEIVLFLEETFAIKTQHSSAEDGWEIIRADFADLSFREQVRLASSARIMLGAHGDGLSWAVFMRPNSVLMEMAL